MDVIRLTGIRAYGYLGAFPEEQVLGQWFEVDLSIWLDLSLPIQSDRLTDTLDYGLIVKQVQELLKTSRFALLERMAGAIVEAILYPPNPHNLVVQQVQVGVTKLTPPIPDFAGQVSVELMRQRSPDSP